MRVVSREDIIEKLSCDADNIVDNIMNEFNNRTEPDFFYVDKKFYNNANRSVLNIVISKLNEILKDYKYIAYENYQDGFCIKYIN